MSSKQKVRRFRANPVEVAIFSIIMLVFCHSVYSLFYDTQLDYSAIFANSSASTLSRSRSIASSSISSSTSSSASSSTSAPSSDLITFAIQCDHTEAQTINSSKVRLEGPLCGTDETLTAHHLLGAQISNTTNQFQATVFTNVNDGKFSTDYMPLDSGKNTFHVEFRYHGGKIVSQDLDLTKAN